MNPRPAGALLFMLLLLDLEKTKTKQRINFKKAKEKQTNKKPIHKHTVQRKYMLKITLYKCLHDLINMLQHGSEQWR